MKCILCKNNDYIQIKDKTRSGDEFKVVECTKCGHVQLNPIPSAEDTQIYFDNNKEVKEIFETIYNKIDVDFIENVSGHDTDRYVDFIEKNITKTDKILEIGSGDGMFVHKMKNLGYDIDGLEISKEKREISKACFGNELLKYNFLIDEVEKEMVNKYDVICGFHVFQQLNNPIKYLQKLKVLLKKNGKIIFELPNYNDHMLSKCQTYNDFYFHKAQLSYYKPDILKKLFDDNGFANINIIGLQRYSFVNAINWLYKGKPQINKDDRPIYNAKEPLSWLENYYKSVITKDIISDTMIIIATN